MSKVIRTKMDRWGGIEVSRLGFGIMRLPLRDGKIDRTESQRMVDMAWEGGVNYFDTAYTYLGSESELFLGEALKRYPRDQYYIATKSPIWLIERAEQTAFFFGHQLEKLQADYIDFYLLHSVSGPRWPNVRRCQMIETLDSIKRAGRIKRLGFSFHGDIDTFREVVDCYDWDFAQIQINYADNTLIGAGAYHDILRQKGIPCIAMEPVRGGFLANPPEAVRREMDAAPGHRLSPTGWAMRWCISRDNMPVILSGMSTREQVAENLETFSRAEPLTPAQEDMLSRAAEVLAGIKSVPCTACGYCMDCPFGVDIPRIFAIYNQFQLFGNAFRANSDYNGQLMLGHGADKCTACGACAPQCPQGIGIPGRLAELHRVLLECYGG